MALTGNIDSFRIMGDMYGQMELLPLLPIGGQENRKLQTVVVSTLTKWLMDIGLTVNVMHPMGLFARSQKVKMVFIYFTLFLM